MRTRIPWLLLPAIAISVLVAVAPAAAATRPEVHLSLVSPRTVNEAFPIKGQASQMTTARYRLELQRISTVTHRWFEVDSQYVTRGYYHFADQRWPKPGQVQYRTVLHRKGSIVAISNVVTVTITAAKPATVQQSRTVDSAYCPQLVVTSRQQTRSVGWRWDSAAGTWVAVPTSWVTVSETERAAGAPDCVKIVTQRPAAAALPDLRIKDLTKCGKGDFDATGGTCFLIVPSAPFNADFPSLEGRKLLKFGVITLNVGAGPGEVIADRSATSATDWKAYQSFYDANGTLLGSMADPDVQFYFAGDGHNHWHVRDFDEYDLLDATGTTVAQAEKHGYCMQDNTTYTPMQGLVGVPLAPVYAESTSCGKALPQALTIIHGLSRGWGDTYPTSLPDQAIDITGLPDGVYTVRVHADAVGAVVESDEGNNVASLQVQITGNAVSVVPGSSAGGLP